MTLPILEWIVTATGWILVSLQRVIFEPYSIDFFFNFPGKTDMILIYGQCHRNARDTAIPKHNISGR